MIEKIAYENELYAIIIRADYDSEGIQFFTPDDFSQQMAFMGHKKGHEIIPHFHNRVERTVHYTQEVLVIRQGVLRVNFYNSDKVRVQTTLLNKDDIILLCNGGHGFEVVEDVKMVEIKQGPYLQENDKVRFEPAGDIVDEYKH